MFDSPDHLPFRFGQGTTAVVLVHGFPGTPAELRTLGEELAMRGYVSVGVSLPGFGREFARIGTVDHREWIGHLAEEIRRLRGDYRYVVLLGYSMGAAVALSTAADERVDGLILVAPFWNLGSPLARLLPVIKRLVPMIAPFRRANFQDPAVGEQIRLIAPGTDLDDPAVQRSLREQLRLPTSALDQVRRVGIQAFRAAASVQVPTLVLQLADDVTVPADRTRQLANRLGGTMTYRELPGSHQAIRTKPDLHPIASEVVAYLEHILPAAETSEHDIE